MKIMRKSLLVTLVAILMVFSVLAGCSTDQSSEGNKEEANDSTNTETNKENTSNEEKKFVLGEQALEISLYGNYDWYTMPTWGEDVASKWILENKKVTVTPVSSGGNAAQKFNTMIVSNELPDVMWMERGPDVEKLRQAGLLVPFDEYLDKYPNLKEWLGEAGINMLRSPDGKLYQFPNWYTSQPNGNAGYVVNKKIYTELGSPKLETTEDLYNYLKSVKEKYPNVVPFEAHIDAQGLNVLYSAFAEGHSPVNINMHGVPNGDKLTSIFTDSMFRETMQYASKLFREKLMSQDALTQTLDQVKEKMVNGNVAVYAAPSPTDIGYVAHSQLVVKDPNAGYIMIWPVHKEGFDKNNIWPGTYTQLGWNVNVITKAAKDPEAVFAFLDWLTGPEGQRILFWGPEGKYWNGLDAEGFPVFKEEYVTDAKGVADLQGVTGSFMWNGNTVYVDKAKSKFELTLPEEKRNWATNWQATITWKTQANATEFINLNPAPDSEEGIIAQSVLDIFTEARAKALYAQNDADVIAILDQAEADAQAAGYSKLLEFKTQKWQENAKQIQGN
jgi:putative aldouronate transport system substrate-binding protein